MKLTNSIRESVVKQIENKVMPPRLAPIMAKAQAFADEFFKNRGDIPFTEVPKRFEKFVRHIGSCSMYNNEGSNLEIKLSNAYCSQNGYLERITVSDAIVTAFNKAHEEWWQEKKAIEAVLNSCTTTKQLIETMPELEEFLPKENSTVGGALVAVETIEKAKNALRGVQK